MAYEIQYLRPTLSNSASHPPNKPQGVLEPWTMPVYLYGSGESAASAAPGRI